MPWDGLEQLECARHRERQHEPVWLRQGQCELGGRDGSALVAKFAVRNRRQQIRLNDCDVADDGCCPVHNVLGCGESRGRVPLGQGDNRPGISDLAGACQLRIEYCQRRAGLTELPEPSLRG